MTTPCCDPVRIRPNELPPHEPAHHNRTGSCLTSSTWTLPPETHRVRTQTEPDYPRSILVDFAQRTIDLARQNVADGGRPFATVIVRGNEVLAESPNKVAQTGDPTAHAEVLAISRACRQLGTEHLTNASIYVLAQPCPMCLGALYYCSPAEVVFLTTREACEPHYVDDRKYFELSTFYAEFAKDYTQRRMPMRHDPRDDAVEVYRFWQQCNGGSRYVPGAPTAP